ncbi:MAG: ABC-2 family transporter protein [Patescibacteria group bacterium]|jgi:ABC-2 type transport system permease protein
MGKFKKYATITKMEMSRQMTHRFNIICYRVGNFFEVLVPLVVWTAAFRGATIIKGYTYDEMITYVIVGWLILYLTASYGFEEVAARLIYDGTLSQFIIKPISFLRYVFTLGLSRSVMAVFLSVLIQAAVIFFARGHIVARVGMVEVIILLAMIFMALIIRMLYSILISLAAFWTDEISGVDFTASTLNKFLSGAYFPINLLPVGFANFAMATPFIYTLYYPTSIILGKVSVAEAARGLAVELLWILVMYGIIKLVWRAGLKKYESVGI